MQLPGDIDTLIVKLRTPYRGRIKNRNKELLITGNAYVIAYERLTGVDGDVERVISIRQESPLLSYAVSVPQLKAEVGRWVLLDAYLIEEHVR